MTESWTVDVIVLLSGALMTSQFVLKGALIMIQPWPSHELWLVTPRLSPQIQAA